MKNKKIFLMIFCLLFATISKSELTDKFNIDSNTTTTVNDKDGSIPEKVKEIKIDGKTQSQAIEDFENTDKNFKDVSKISEKFDMEKLFEDVENYYNVFDQGSENFFSTVSAIGDTVSGVLGLAGAFPTMAGVGVIGTNIQATLNKILDMKNRVDQLKQYKRHIDSIRNLSKADFKTLAGINNTLNLVSDMVNDGKKIADKSKGLAKKIRSADLSTKEGWESLISEDENLREQNDIAVDKINGDEAKAINKAIAKAKKKIKEMKADNEVKNLQQLNGQMGILIQLMEQLINNQSAQALAQIQEQNKRIEEEIAIKQFKADQMEELKKYNQEIDKAMSEIKLGTKFVGSVNGNRE